MQQKVLIATPISLFEVLEGTAVERGSCACAIVAAVTTSGRPKYSAVCYNDRRETLCVAPITTSIENSIQFQLSTGTHASFRDGTGKFWRCVFLSEAKLQAFLAALGIAAYALAGRRERSTHTSDFMPLGVGVCLQQHNRARVHYTAYAIQGSDLPLLGDLLESNGDELYCFRPVPSTAALLQGNYPDAFGFECGVIGMSEGSIRAIVVPAAALPHGRRNLYGADGAVFVVKMVNVLQEDPLNMEKGEGVPTVLTFGDDPAGDVAGGGALVITSNVMGSNSNQVESVVPFSGGTANEMRDVPPPQSMATVQPGGGVPPEHMDLIQRLGMLLTGAVENARNVRSISEATAAEWRHAINRPKPSRLTNAALVQAVQQLVMESDRIADSIAQRDGLIREIEKRNRELQQRVDSAAIASQQLLDEKNECTRSASDMRLEKERAIMQLQQQINQASMERDDAQRHLQTVKQLLHVSETELREIRGNAALSGERTSGATSSLSALQDALAEERSRRKALDSTLESLQQQMSSAQTELHVKNAQLEDMRRSVDMQRTHYAQVIDDERQRRTMEVQQLRTEFITELQAREAKFLADRARVGEENFRRGQAEGRSSGRANSRGNASEQRLQELTFEAQRTLAELNVCREELRQAAEDGMVIVRTTSARAARLKAQLHEENFKRGRLEMLASNARGRLQGGRDKILSAFTSVAHRLRRPVKASDLMFVVDSLKKRRAVDFSFQEREYAAEVASVTRRRYQWIEETMVALYREDIERVYNEWLEPLLALRDATTEAVNALMIQRDGEAFFQFNTSERRGRFEINMEMENFFRNITDMFQEEMGQRRQLLAQAQQAVSKLLEESAENLDSLSLRWFAELEQREQLRSECARTFATILLKEEAEFRSIAMEARTGANIVDQNDLIATEGGVRSAIDSEECAELSGLMFDYESEKGIIVRNAAFMEEARTIISEEEERRGCIVSEENTTLQIAIDLYAPYIQSLRPALDAPEMQEEIDPVEAEGPPPADAYYAETAEAEGPPPADAYYAETAEAEGPPPADAYYAETAEAEGPPPVDAYYAETAEAEGPPPADAYYAETAEAEGPPPADAYYAETAEAEGPPPADAYYAETAEAEGPPPVDAYYAETAEAEGPPPVDAYYAETAEAEGPPPVDAYYAETAEAEGPPPVDAYYAETAEAEGPPPADAYYAETAEAEGPPPVDAYYAETAEAEGPPPVDAYYAETAEAEGPPPVDAYYAETAEAEGPPPADAYYAETAEAEGPPPVDAYYAETAEAEGPPPADAYYAETAGGGGAERPQPGKGGAAGENSDSSSDEEDDGPPRALPPPSKVSAPSHVPSKKIPRFDSSDSDW